MTLIPGRVAKLPLTIAMSDKIASKVVDGVASFTIRFVRPESDVPLPDLPPHGDRLAGRPPVAPDDPLQQ